ncbi:MAG: hypothetical protein A2293_00295 [Elusimicrobia bacterium RIFOXYB2_FULL_49_7]|nr:MAG: hypothetical protein A2293_00295 [Elusimicrobia bacterium RIFOXYB2_FULL_49_7]
MDNKTELPPQPDFSSGSERIHDDFHYHSKDVPSPILPAEKKTSPSAAPSPKPINPLKKEGGKKESDEIDFLKYLAIVLRRKKVVFITLFCVIVLNFIKDMGQVDLYRADTKLLVQVRKPNPIGDQEYSYFWDQQTRINTMLNAIKSRDILKRVIDTLGLDMPLDALVASIAVSKIQETNIILISVTLTDPELSARVVNTLAQEFINYNNEVTRKDISDAIRYIEMQIEKTSRELKEREEALKNYQQDNRLIERMPESDSEVEKLTNLEIALQNTIVEITENDEKINQLTKLLKQEKLYIEQSFTFDNTIETQLIDLNVELARTLAEYGEQHRQVKQLKENIRKLTELAKQSRDGVNKISSTKSLNQNRIVLLQEYNDRTIAANSLRARRTAYEKVLRELNESIKGIPEKYLLLRRLQREKENVEKIYTLLQEKYQEQRIRYEMQSSDVVQWEVASIPKSPIPQGSRFGFLIVVVVGLIAGVGMVFAIEFLDQSIKSPQEIEEELQLPLLGIIPLMNDEDKVLALDSKSKILEPYRSLRTNIRYTNLGADKRTLLLTSAIQGDGKTTKACNLAISFALDGKKVMIVDADLRRSSVHKLFNVEKENGLSEYLTLQADYAQVKKPAFNGAISVVPAGKRPPNPAEILGSPRLQELIREGLSDHDLVIIDSPALVPVSDALLIAPYVSSTIIVGRAFKTPLKAMHFTKNSLQRVNTNIIGVIFNGVEQRRGYYPYYYTYYSYYSYYRSRYYQYYNEEDELAGLPKNFKEFLLFSAKELYVDIKKRIRHSKPALTLFLPIIRQHRRKFFLALVLTGAMIAVYVLRHGPFAPFPKQTTRLRYSYVPSATANATSHLQPTVQGTVGISESELIQLVRDIHTAVKEENFNLYKTFYSKTRFRNTSGGYSEWMANRLSAFKRLQDESLVPGSIVVLSQDSSQAMVVFEKSYQEGWFFKTARSYRMKLKLEKDGNRWKIIGEGRIR